MIIKYNTPEQEQEIKTLLEDDDTPSQGSTLLFFTEEDMNETIMINLRDVSEIGADADDIMYIIDNKTLYKIMGQVYIIRT